MANVPSDSQTFLSHSVATDRKSTSPRLWARNRDLSATPSEGLRMPQQEDNRPDSRGLVTGTSQDNAVLISSDEDSDYSDFDDGQSDTYVSFGSSGNKDAEEPSGTEEAQLDNEIALSQQQQVLGLQRSPVSPSTPAPPWPSSAWPGPLHAKHDQSSSALFALCGAEQVSIPRDATGGTTEEIFCASPPAVAASYPSSSRGLSTPSSPCPEEGTGPHSTPHCNSASERDSDDEAEPPEAKPNSRRVKTVVRQGIRRSLGTFSVYSDNEDEAAAEAEVEQQSDCQDDPQQNAGCRPHHNTDNEDSEREQEEEGNNIRPPQRKRRKTSSPADVTLRAATGRRSRSDVFTVRSQHQRSPPSQNRSSQRSIPSPPSSQGSRHEETPDGPVAKFEQWPLKNCVLKRVTVNGLATIQLEFNWDSCTNHKRKDRATRSRRCERPVKRREEAVRIVKKPGAFRQRRKRTTQQFGTQPPAIIDDEGNEEWEVERIEEVRLTEDSWEALVKWRGFIESTWEPLENVWETTALDEYERLHGPLDNRAGDITDVIYAAGLK